MTGRWITLTAADGHALRAWLVVPPQGSGPGLVLLHEMVGLNAFARDMAARYAEEGYVTVVPDLYARQATDVELDYDAAGMARAAELRADLTDAEALTDIDAARAALAAEPTCRGRSAVVGFSMGGRLALLAAARGGFACAVSWYGTGLEADDDTLATLPCPALLLMGEQDDKVPAQARAAIETALASSPAARCVIFPGCAHGFANPARPAFDKPAASLAFSRALAFLRGEIGPVFDLASLWEAHTAYEFASRDVDATMATMVDEPYVNHVPTMTGGVGHAHLKRFYKHHFVNANPPDTRLVPVSRTVGSDSLVDEMLFCFTHTCEVPWMLPGVPPTGRYVEIPLVAIVKFRGDKLCHEHIYWDQASVLVQVGLLDPAGLPVAGIATAKKLLDESLPSNELMAERWARSAALPLD